MMQHMEEIMQHRETQVVYYNGKGRPGLIRAYLRATVDAFGFCMFALMVFYGMPLIEALTTELAQ